MMITKLKEALTEMREQRARLDAAIASHERTIALLEDGLGSEDRPARRTSRVSEDGKASYIDDAEAILQKIGTPLHVKELLRRIAESRSVPVQSIPRPSLESTLNRHIAKAKPSRIAKLAPSTYGLPAWKSQPLAFPVITGPESVAS